MKRNITRAFELKGVVKCFLPAMIGVTIFTMKRNGPDYVDQPKYISILKSSNLYFSLFHQVGPFGQGVEGRCLI